MTTRILAFVWTVVFPFMGTAVLSPVTSAAPAQITQEQAAKDLPKTIVVRVDSNGQATVLESGKVLTMDDAGKAEVERLADEFKSLNTAGTHEMDQASSTSSWYWYNPGYYGYGYGYAPVYSYYGYSYYYRPCFNYAWGGFNYIWYNWRW